MLHFTTHSLFIFGDFNDRCLEWESDHSHSELKLKLFDLILQNDLHQLINEYTHITYNSAYLLDLAITDSPARVLDSGTLPPIGSGHSVIFIKSSFTYKHDANFLREIWNYKTADFNSLNELLINNCWDNLNVFDDIDDAVFYFNEFLLSAARDFIPNRSVLVRPRDKPWMNNTIRKLLRKRDRSYRKFKRTHKDNHEQIWQQDRRNCHLAINQAKLRHKNSLIDMLNNLHLNPRKYWKVVKSIYGQKKTFQIPSITHNGQNFTTSVDKAHLFNVFFSSQQMQTDIPQNHKLPPLEFRTDSRLNEIIINEHNVLKALKQINPNKASGPDGISGRLLLETADSICKPLSLLFNKSLQSGIFPSEWKKANITPVHKKQDKSVLSNYRPISLLPCIAKIFEKIVYDNLYNYLSTNTLLTWRNAGFKKNDSTINQLVYISNLIINALDDGDDVCMVFLDVSKAFDRVWHAGLLHKLRGCGIGGSLFEWLRSYLQNRKQRVVLNGQNSAWAEVYSGVPQGSILGPLLYLVFSDDLIQFLESNAFLFADDTSLVEIIKNYTASFSRINRDLEWITRWAVQWLVIFSEIKTFYMITSKKRNRPVHPPLIFNDVILSEVTEHSHLGITINNNFTWKEHIRKIQTKANKCLGILRSVSNDLPRTCKERIYKTLIRPVMEYGDVIFDGSPNNATKLLDSVQRQAALTCTGAFYNTNTERLMTEVGWESLENRRKHHRLGLFYKIKNKLTPPYMYDLCPAQQAGTARYQLRNQGGIPMPFCRTQFRRNSFVPQTISDWNKLPPQIQICATLNSFKYRFRQSYFKPVPPWYSRGKSRTHVILTRIRLNNSSLNSHLHANNIIDSPKCHLCQSSREDVLHYFLQCPAFIAARIKLLRGLSEVISLDVNDIPQKDLLSLLITGSANFSLEQNSMILEQTVNYITSSSRF